MSKANEEQLKAIEHNGGVLLNAGAGSGKTFVLIEHIKFIIDEFFKDNKKYLDNSTLLEQSLQKHLSKIVLMTFTNEAAKELKSRLYSKFESEVSFPLNLVYDNLKFINVSTIHGFCLKLIKSGMIQQAPSDFELKDEYQIELKINRLIKVWFENQVESEDFSLFVKNYDAIKKSMNKIFNSPELRSSWRRKVSDHEKFDERNYFMDLFELLDFKTDITSFVDLSEYSKNSATKWYQYLDQLNSIRGNLHNWQEFQKFDSIYALVGKVMPPRGNEDIREVLSDCSEIRKFLKSNSESFNAFFNNQDQFKIWQDKLIDLFNFVDTGYYNDNSISFSDLEFLVYETLHKDINVQEEIAKKYSYFIVDEFQDTSHVQFEILRACIQNDFSKIFCVGDKKQAIYGFRGGELAVFNNLSKIISKNLSMKNNYRSEEKVVNFNNELFSFIFPLGKNFEDRDNFTVDVEAQTFPSTKEKMKGDIKRFIINPVTENEKLSNDDLSTLEAMQICNSISQEIDSGADDICVLYRNLGPSKYLIEQLIEKKISFEAQVKIPYGEDPVFILFKALIDTLIKSRSPDQKIERLEKYLNFYVYGVLKHFNLTCTEILETTFLTKIINEINEVGIEVVFYKFIQRLGISNSLFNQNSNKILQIISSNFSNIDKIWDSLRAFNSEKYSTRFYYGLNSKVKIMTTHASKGLQFDSVYLGGIHTNGRSINNPDFIGDLPGSFKWTPELSRKKMYMSPMFIYENKLSAAKEFSESKRLFYVACTRAVKNIYWTDIEFNEKPQLSYKSSWVNALRMFDYNLIEEQRVSIDYSFQRADKAPIYFKDDLGISLNSNGELGLISELSVTNLAVLALCSRKFYIKQLMKLEDDWLEYSKLKDIKLPKKFGVSDKDRGIKIHSLLENYILKNEIGSKKPDEIEILKWFNNVFEPFRNSQKILVEKEMKFSLFGQMITGIADLIVQVNDHEYEIWDFKTGLEDEGLSKSYDFQLECYALGLGQIEKLSDDALVTLRTLYLDEQKIKNRSCKISEIKRSLSNTWQNLSDYSYKRNSHCDVCEYGNLCHS